LTERAGKFTKYSNIEARIEHQDLDSFTVDFEFHKLPRESSKKYAERLQKTIEEHVRQKYPDHFQ